MHEPESTALRLKHAERALRRAMDKELAGEGITFEQWQALAALLEQPGLRMTALADAACLPAASLTRQVDHLVGVALVIRRIDPADRRSAVVALSPRGQQVAERLRRVERQFEASPGRVDAALSQAARPGHPPLVAAE